MVPSITWQVSTESQRIPEIAEELHTSGRNTLAHFKQRGEIACALNPAGFPVFRIPASDGGG